MLREGQVTTLSFQMRYISEDFGERKDQDSKVGGLILDYTEWKCLLESPQTAQVVKELLRKINPATLAEHRRAIKLRLNPKPDLRDAALLDDRSQELPLGADYDLDTGRAIAETAKKNLGKKRPLEDDDDDDQEEGDVLDCRTTRPSEDEELEEDE